MFESYFSEVYGVIFRMSDLYDTTMSKTLSCVILVFQSFIQFLNVNKLTFAMCYITTKKRT